MEWGPKAIADGNDLQAREQVQWASLVALNGWVQTGTASAFPVHMIEHSISAHHDIAHGAGLSAINPAWMRFAARNRPARFCPVRQPHLLYTSQRHGRHGSCHGRHQPL